VQINRLKNESPPTITEGEQRLMKTAVDVSSPTQQQPNGSGLETDWYLTKNYKRLLKGKTVSLNNLLVQNGTRLIIILWQKSIELNYAIRWSNYIMSSWQDERITSTALNIVSIWVRKTLKDQWKNMIQRILVYSQ